MKKAVGGGEAKDTGRSAGMRTGGREVYPAHKKADPPTRRPAKQALKNKKNMQKATQNPAQKPNPPPLTPMASSNRSNAARSCSCASTSSCLAASRRWIRVLRRRMILRKRRLAPKIDHSTSNLRTRRKRVRGRGRGGGKRVISRKAGSGGTYCASSGAEDRPQHLKPAHKRQGREERVRGGGGEVAGQGESGQ